MELTCIRVRPAQEPEIVTIEDSLTSYQSEVDGFIECVYPFDDDACIICNEEGKINGMPLNRGLCDENGELYDIVAGTFLIVGCSNENFASLTPAQLDFYMELYHQPEYFVYSNGAIRVLRG